MSKSKSNGDGLVAMVDPAADHAAELIEVFGETNALISGTFIPVLSLMPGRAFINGMGTRRIYELDLERVTDAQRTKLVASLCRRHKMSVESIERYLETAGYPILCDDVIPVIVYRTVDGEPVINSRKV